MSFADCLDHTATVYRLSEALDGLRAAVNTYTAQPDSVGIGLAPSNLTRSDLGAGEALRGRRAAFALAGAGVVATDVLKITAGAEAPARYRVLEATKAPMDHHTVLEIEPYRGALPGD